MPLPAAVLLFGAGLISLVGLGAGGLEISIDQGVITNLVLTTGPDTTRWVSGPFFSKSMTDRRVLDNQVARFRIDARLTRPSHRVVTLCMASNRYLIFTSPGRGAIGLYVRGESCLSVQPVVGYRGL